MRKVKSSRYPAIDVYASARQFVEATIHAGSQKPPMIFALITNCAFAIELLLKTLIALENGDEFPNDHSLFRLYQKLRTDTKKEIEDGWKTHCNSPPIQKMAAFVQAEQEHPVDLRLSKCLLESENAFISFRYAFERSEKPLPAFFLSGFEQVLAGIILRQHPEFASQHPRMAAEA